MKEFTINGITVRKVQDYPYYAVSKCGRVFRIKTGKEIKRIPRKNNGVSYLHFTAYSEEGSPRNLNVHKAVANEWLESPRNSSWNSVNHIDGNTLNNHATNLEWVSPAMNTQHAALNGLKPIGEQHYLSELSNDIAHLICQDLCDGMRVKDISDRYDVSKDIIRKIRSGSSYFHVRCLYNIPHEYKTDFSEQTVRWVCEKILLGFSDRKIPALSSNKNLNMSEVKRIRYKIRYKNISDEYF